MKLVLIAIAVVAVLVGLTVQQAQANAFLSIQVGATTVSCNTTTLAGCATPGFNTGGIGSNTITFTGVVGGVSFGEGAIVGVQLVSNQPGTPALAFVLDTKTLVHNVTASTQTITVDWAVNGFTQPVGTGFLSASQTANWTNSAAGDSQAFTAWERNTNDLIVPGGTVTAASPNCVSAGGLSQSCSSITPDVPASPTAPFALTGREVIVLSPDRVASYTATSTLTAQPTRVPEPGSLVLLGTGLTMLAGLQWRKRRK